MNTENPKIKKHMERLAEISSKRVTYKLVDKIEIENISEKKTDVKSIQKEREIFVCNALEELVRQKMKQCATEEVYASFTPSIYTRRNDLSDDKNIVVMAFYIESTDVYRVFFRDYTPPNKPFYGELYNHPNLAEWISAVEWNESTQSYEYLSQGIIPNIWATLGKSKNNNTSPIWATPNFRPYIRKVQDYIQNGELLRDLILYKKLYYRGK